MGHFLWCLCNNWTKTWTEGQTKTIKLQVQKREEKKWVTAEFSTSLASAPYFADLTGLVTFYIAVCNTTDKFFGAAALRLCHKESKIRVAGINSPHHPFEMPWVWQASVSQWPVKRHGPLERSGVVKATLSSKLLVALLHTVIQLTPEGVTTHSCKAGFMDFNGDVWKPLHQCFLCFQPVTLCMHFFLYSCVLYFYCMCISIFLSVWKPRDSQFRYACMTIKYIESWINWATFVYYLFFSGSSFQKVYEQFSKPGGCRNGANLLFSLADEHFTGRRHWVANLTHLGLHSQFLCSLPGKQRPPNKSSWTAGPSWCCCTPTSCSSSLYCRAKHITRLRWSRFNPQERVKGVSQSVFLTFRVTFGKSLALRTSRCHRWGPGCCLDRCLPGAQSRRPSPRRSRPEESAESPPVASPPAGWGAICSPSW